MASPFNKTDTVTESSEQQIKTSKGADVQDCKQAITNGFKTTQGCQI